MQLFKAVVVATFLIGAVVAQTDDESEEVAGKLACDYVEAAACAI
jgi:hypothetical protein